jgi:hypothetical protein
MMHVHGPTTKLLAILFLALLAAELPAQSSNRSHRLQTRDSMRSGEIELRGVDEEGDYRSDLGHYQKDDTGPLAVDNESLRARRAAIYQGIATKSLPRVVEDPHQVERMKMRGAQPLVAAPTAYPVALLGLFLMALAGGVTVRFILPRSRRARAPAPPSRIIDSSPAMRVYTIDSPVR